jgi:hypothetical protein
MTVGGDRETHCGQELMVYHQGVCQGDGTCRQGLPLQSIAGRFRVGSTPRGELGETDSVRTLLSVTVEEPLSDDEDEDGVPHCVSDSESESEIDSD